MARTSSRVTVLAVALGAAAATPVVGVASADVIHLVSGTEIQVDAWRDVGDAIEFSRGGGIIRIPKRDVARIEGQSVKQDLRMYSAPASLSGSALRAAADREGALRDMNDLLKQGEDLFGQTTLSSRSKADAFRRLGSKWKDLDVPEPLREAFTRGQDALQMSVEAYTAEDEGTAPNAKERIDSAKKAVEEAHELVKKAESPG
jgi:hypothetical protein